MSVRASSARFCLRALRLVEVPLVRCLGSADRRLVLEQQRRRSASRRPCSRRARRSSRRSPSSPRCGRRTDRRAAPRARPRDRADRERENALRTCARLRGWNPDGKGAGSSRSSADALVGDVRVVEAAGLVLMPRSRAVSRHARATKPGKRASPSKSRAISVRWSVVASGKRRAIELAAADAERRVRAAATSASASANEAATSRAGGAHSRAGASRRCSAAPGSARGSDSQVLRPMITAWPSVSARKRLQVLGKSPRQPVAGADDAVRARPRRSARRGERCAAPAALGAAAGGGVLCARPRSGRGRCHNCRKIIAAPATLVYYPRSFLKFILLGFLLVSLPLLYALGELILSLDRLADAGPRGGAAGGAGRAREPPALRAGDDARAHRAPASDPRRQRAARRLRSRPPGVPRDGATARAAAARSRAAGGARCADRQREPAAQAADDAAALGRMRRAQLADGYARSRRSARRRCSPRRTS